MEERLKNKLAYYELLKSMKIDPDSDEGIDSNPYECPIIRRMWLAVEASQSANHKKSEDEKFLEEFYRGDLKHIKPLDLYEINYSNKINFNGRVLDVKKLTAGDVLLLMDKMTMNESNELYFTEHVQSLFHTSTPKVKLYYPEPYIASPSRIHTDLWIIHILHYQFWLWFFFIFLVVFFFIVFIITVRWNQVQNRPRRETRGVSRSKCGDLITACVPVSWAASIIVSESTDSTDINDGFSTGELVVGVRAYQWGWEYYYPKSIDLNYNVKPSYSTFIGDSVKYDSTSATTVDSNNFWRHYQRKSLESVVTPAHLLLLPFDNSNVAGFANFSDVGVNTLKQSAAFAKIRANSKLFNTNVVSNPDEFALKYSKINNLAFNDNSTIESLNYGNLRQHNLVSSQAVINNLSTFLTSNDMTSFLNSSDTVTSPSYSNFLQLTSVIHSELYKKNSNHISNISLHSNQLDLINDSSDKKQVGFVFPGLVSKLYQQASYLTDKLQVTGSGSLPMLKVNPNHISSNLNVTASPIKILNKGDNTSVLSSDQLTQSYSNIKLGYNNFNLSSSTNNILSSVSLNYSILPIKSVFSALNNNSTLNVDFSQFNKLATRRSSFNYPHPILFSNNPDVNIYEYDTNKSIKKSIKFGNNKVVRGSLSSRTPVNLAISGDQSGMVSNLNSAYWRMFWSLTDASKRLQSSPSLFANESDFYMPIFTNYYDYDFRNAQAMELLEDLFWESSYSSYNFSDYMVLSQNFLKAQPLSNGDLK